MYWSKTEQQTREDDLHEKEHGVNILTEIKQKSEKKGKWVADKDKKWQRTKDVETSPYGKFKEKNRRGFLDWSEFYGS